MIRDVGNIELCELLETERKTQWTVCLSYWTIGIVCTCGHFLRKGRGANQQFIKYTMDFPSILEYVIKKGRPHRHRYGWKPGDGNIFDQQWEEKCKKFFQGIHDRFIRDPEFRNQMIESGRDENVCPQWDALADEDLTHLLTPQEYYHTRVNGGLLRTKQVLILCLWSTDLTSNKHCLLCGNWKKKECLQMSANSRRNQKWAEFFFMVELARFLVDSLFLWKSRWRWTKYW